MDGFLRRLDGWLGVVETDAAALISATGVIEHLHDAEAGLLASLHRSGVGAWTGPPPAAQPGHPLFALAPYWLKLWAANPPPFVAQHAVLRWMWSGLAGLVDSNMTPELYETLLDLAGQDGGGYVAEDGAIYAPTKYHQMDPDWIYALVDYLVVRLFDDRAPFGRLPTPPPAPTPLVGRSPGEVRLALLGDWGTGVYADDPAGRIMDRIGALAPDYIVHLGDVYYAGADEVFQPGGEEARNFLDLWPSTASQAPGTSFMLNSNHEMYSGAKGYFQALADPRFSGQKGASYFALAFGGWTLVGLDTAYWDASAMFMQGGLAAGDPQRTQPAWLAALGLDPARTILMSHHNGLTYDGARETALWAETAAALGGDPAAWYWGHIHDGIAYATPTVTGRATRARCVGHGAFPFGDAWGLAAAAPPRHLYYAHTPNPAAPPRVRNGFVLLTLAADGRVTEAWHEDGADGPVFETSWGGAPP